MNDVLQEALTLYDLGFNVIPLVKNTKRPKLKKGELQKYRYFRPPRQKVIAWFKQNGDVDVAIMPGTSGWIVRDFDDPKAFTDWLSQHPDLADRLPVVTSAKGGHVYAHCPDDVKEWKDKSRCCTTEEKGEIRVFAICAAPPSGGKMWIIRPTAEPDKMSLDKLGFGWGLRPERRVLHSKDTALTQAPHRYNPATTQDISDGVASSSQAQNLATFELSEPDLADLFKGCLPTRTGQRNAMLFKLARRLRDRMPEAKPKDLGSIFEQWFTRAEPYIATKDREESWTDLLQAWDAVHTPEGHGAKSQMKRILETEPPPPVARIMFPLPESNRIHTLVSACYHLARLKGESDRSFFLSAEDAAELAGYENRQSAFNALKQLCKVRIIRKLKSGNRKAANVYVWIGRDGAIS